MKETQTYTRAPFEMTEQLFKKCLAFADIHFGKRSDSEQHNHDCMHYMTWLQGIVRKERPDTVLFFGDWFDNQSRLRHDTTSYGYHAMRSLHDEVARVGGRTFVIIGNHDTFYGVSGEPLWRREPDEFNAFLLGICNLTLRPRHIDPVTTV